jgi:hypothetical protein
MKTDYLQLIAFLVMTFWGASTACMGELDRYSSGVVFNNNEQCNLQFFDNIGGEKQSYFKDCMMIEPSPDIKNVTVVGPNVKVRIDTDPVTIQSVKLANNILELTVTYGGGCTAHEFNLIAFEGMENTTTPPTVNFQLSHNANGDECKALITETLVFNLLTFEALKYAYPLYLKILVPSVEKLQNATKLLWYPNNSCFVKYRSHFFSDAMVYLDFYTPYGATQFFPRMAVVIDPKIQSIKAFEYDKAVSTELQWLIKLGVISGITEKKFSLITESLHNKQGQYWTFQDSLIGYNAGFSLIVNTEGTWKWGDMGSVKSSCGLDVEFTLPPDTLDMISTSTVNKKGSQNVQDNFSARLAGGNCILELPEPSLNNEYFTLVDLRGSVLFRASVPVGRSSVVVPFNRNFSKGIYYAVYPGQGKRMKCKLLISD